MKYIDFSGLFDLGGIELALLSTFNFDPDYFERRLLAETSLADARRIAVFMDCGQWHQLLSEDIPARLINQRYLVVPVRHSPGVFHPKLHVCLSGEEARVLCGSGNLTRAGCTHNLELTNSVPVGWGKDGGAFGSAELADQALRFFETAADRSDGDAGVIAKKWIQHYRQAVGWKSRVKASGGKSSDLQVELLHSYDGKLWDRLVESLGVVAPDRLLVISPYFDEDAALIRRARKAWPHCRLEIVAQQTTSTLPIAAIKKARCGLSLFELTNASRRLHAKLVAWESNGASGCIVGSANFTTAAWDGLNVEACLYLRDASKRVEALFDSKFPRKAIKLDDFMSGNEIEPRPHEGEAHALVLESAVVDSKGHLGIVYKCDVTPLPKVLTMRIRLGDARRSPIDTAFHVSDGTKAKMPFPEEARADSRNSLSGSLVVEVDGKHVESVPVWIIQENQLTHETPEVEAGKGKTDKRQAGFDLPEVLEEKRLIGGLAAVIEYLNGFTISFSDGTKRLGMGYDRWGRNDPFHEDELPAWVKRWDSPGTDLREALCKFARRHEDKCLSKYAERGNIGAMDNFLDTFVAIVRLLFVFYMRKVVERSVLLRHILTCIEIATTGFETTCRSSRGYLVTSHLKYSEGLPEECEALNFAGTLYAALVVAHVLSHELERPRGSSSIRSKLCMPNMGPKRFGIPSMTNHDPLKQFRSDVTALRAKLRNTLTTIGVAMPSSEDVTLALVGFEMMSDSELACYKSHIGTLLGS